MAAELYEAIPFSLPLVNPPQYFFLTGNGLPTDYRPLRILFSAPGVVVELGPGPEMDRVHSQSTTSRIQIQLSFVTGGQPIFKLPGIYDMFLLSSTAVLATLQGGILVEAQQVSYSFSRPGAQRDELVADLQLTVQGVTSSEVRRLKFEGPTTLNIDGLSVVDSSHVRVSPFFLSIEGNYTARLFADTTELRQLGGTFPDAFRITAPTRPTTLLFGLSQSSAQPQDALTGVKVNGKGFIAGTQITRLRLVSGGAATISFFWENRTDVLPTDPIAGGLFRIIDDTTILLANFTVPDVADYGLAADQGVGFTFLVSTENVLTVKDTRRPTVVFTPDPGAYCGQQLVGLTAFNTDANGLPTTVDLGAQVFYSFDTPPTTATGSLYPPPGGSIVVRSTTVVWAIARDSAGNISEPVSAVYQIGYIQQPEPSMRRERMFINYIRSINTNEMIQALRVKYSALLKEDTVPGVKLATPGNAAANSTNLLNLRKGVLSLLHNVGLSLLEAIPVPRLQAVSATSFRLTPGRETFVVTPTFLASFPSSRIKMLGSHNRVGRHGEDEYSIVFRAPSGPVLPTNGTWTVALLPSRKGLSYYDVWIYNPIPGGGFFKYEGDPSPVFATDFPGLEQPAHIIGTFTVASNAIVSTSVVTIVDSSRPSINDFTDPTLVRADPTPPKDIHWRELEVIITNAVLPSDVTIPTGDSGLRPGDQPLAAKVGESATVPPNFLSPNSAGDIPIPDVIETASATTANVSGGPLSIDTKFKILFEGQGLKTTLQSFAVKPGSINFGGMFAGGRYCLLEFVNGQPSFQAFGDTRGELEEFSVGVLWSPRVANFGFECPYDLGSNVQGSFNVSAVGPAGVMFSGPGRTSFSSSAGGSHSASGPLGSMGGHANWGGCHINGSVMDIQSIGWYNLCGQLMFDSAGVIQWDDTPNEGAVLARSGENCFSRANAVNFPPNVDVTTTDPITRLAVVRNVLLPWNTLGIIWTGSGVSFNPQTDIGTATLGMTTLSPTVTQTQIRQQQATGYSGTQQVTFTLRSVMKVNTFSLVNVGLSWSGNVQQPIDLPAVGSREISPLINLAAAPALEQMFIPFNEITFDKAGQYRLNLSTVNLTKFDVRLLSAQPGVTGGPYVANPQQFTDRALVDFGGGVIIHYGLTSAVRGAISGVTFVVVVNSIDTPVAAAPGSTVSYTVNDKDTATVEVLAIPIAAGGTLVNVDAIFTDNSTVPAYPSALGGQPVYGITAGSANQRASVVPPRLIVRVGQTTNVRAPLNVLVRMTNAANPNEVVVCRLTVNFTFAKALTGLTGIVAINGVQTIVTNNPIYTTTLIDAGGRTVTRRGSNITVSLQDIDVIEVLVRAEGQSSAENFAHIQRVQLFQPNQALSPVDPIADLPDAGGPYDFDIRVGQKYTQHGPVRGLDFRNRTAQRSLRARIRAVDAENSLEVQELFLNVQAISTAFVSATAPQFFVVVNGKITPFGALAGGGVTGNPRVFDATDQDTVEIIMKIVEFGGSGTTVCFVRAATVPDGDPVPPFSPPAQIVQLTPQGTPTLTDSNFLIGTFQAGRSISMVTPPALPPPAPPPVPGPMTGLQFRRDVSKDRALRLKYDFFNASLLTDGQTGEIVIKAQVPTLLTDIVFRYENSRNPGVLLPVQAGTDINGTITGSGSQGDPFVIKVDKPEQFQLFAVPSFASSTTVPLAYLQGEIVFDTSFVELVPPTSDVRAFGANQRFNIVPYPTPAGIPASKPPTGEQLILATGNTNDDSLPATQFNRQSRPYHARVHGVMVGNQANFVDRDVWLIIRDPSVI